MGSRPGFLTTSKSLHEYRVLEFLGGEKSVELVHQVDALPSRESVLLKKEKETNRTLRKPIIVRRRNVVQKQDHLEKAVAVGLGILFLLLTAIF
jgi:hypothetical protein